MVEKIAAPARPTPAVSHDHRRDSLRLPVAKSPNVEVHLEDGAVYQAILMDVSRSGLRVESRECMQCGSLVTIMPPEGEDVPPCRAQIMRQSVIDQSNGILFDYGIRFLPDADKARHVWFLQLRHREAG